ncbi:MAG: TraR/DksA C4-type zinc finger protein [Ktedonobacteraceae bacterium]
MQVFLAKEEELLSAGIWSNCGQPIPEKRLEALPWATLCVTCEPEPGSEG